MVGTVSYRWGDREQDAARTTPEASDLQGMFSDMVEAGVTHAFIEVSSTVFIEVAGRLPIQRWSLHEPYARSSGLSRQY